MGILMTGLMLHSHIPLIYRRRRNGKRHLSGLRNDHFNQRRALGYTSRLWRCAPTIRQPVQPLDKAVVTADTAAAVTSERCMGALCRIKFCSGPLTSSHWATSYRLRPVQVRLLGLPCPFGVLPHILGGVHRQMGLQTAVVKFFGWCNRRHRPYVAWPARHGPDEEPLQSSAIMIGYRPGSSLLPDIRGAVIVGPASTVPRDEVLEETGHLFLSRKHTTRQNGYPDATLAGEHIRNKNANSRSH
jgi:hypothetical protein